MRVSSSPRTFFALALTLTASAAASQETIRSWRTTLPLPVASGAQDAVSYGNHILYVSSGLGNYVGDVDPDTGDVLAWRSTLPIPAGPSLVVAGIEIIGHHVVVPAYPASAVGELAADGSVLSWSLGPSTVTAATGARAVAVSGNRLYAVGGGAPFTVFTSVETATLGPDGTLSPWRLLTPLPFPAMDGLALVHGGFLYFMGGHSSTPGGDLTHGREVHRAPILADGSLGGWTFVGLLLEPRTNADSLRFGDTLHLVAGGVHALMLRSVESVLLDELGHTAEHVLSAPLPTVLNEHATAVVGRFGYVLGGNDRAFGGGPRDSVFVAELGDANRPPVADAGPNLEVEVGANCLAAVELDGSGSYDPDGDALSFTWSGPAGITFPGATVSIELPPGEHTFTLTVRDGRGGEDSAQVTVTAADRTPPVVRASASPARLWPPNHRLVPVTALVDALDACDPAPVCELVSVASSEPVDGLGDGDTAPDWELSGDLAVRLRAERNGRGQGRVYTLTVACADQAGNPATTAVTVLVPKSQGR